jgi:HAD superfamily hydrolase (TIGR01509 family)
VTAAAVREEVPGPAVVLHRPPAGPDAVLFDMDGTLFDSEKLWDVALDDIAARLGGTLSPAARRSMVGTDVSRSLRLLFSDVTGVTPAPDDPRVPEAGRWLLERMAELFAGGLEWLPGARELLHAVRAAGGPVALVTSTHRRLVEVALDTLGRENFDAVVCGDEVARTKPHPDPYLQAAATLGLAPQRCQVFEDSVAGATAAAVAGCSVIVVPWAAPVPADPRWTLLPDLRFVTVA